MSLDFFRIERGLQLDEAVTYLQGVGAPGTSGDSTTVGVGSVYTDTSSGFLYTKYLAGSGTNKWERMASETYVNNAVGATISWREPVKVNDTTTTVPVITGGTPGTDTIDGQTINTGDRVLFSGATAVGSRNVYIYDAGSGNYTEDVNAETNGDALYVQLGSDAGKQFIFNGTNWVQSAQSSLDELGFIRTFIGKSAGGSEATDYSSNNIVVDGTSLETAIGALDLKVGANVTTGGVIVAGNTVNANIQSISDALGSAVTNGNFILAANTTGQNLQSIDTHLGANFAAGNYITLNQTVLGAVTALDTAIGANVANGNFILAANKVQANITALDAEIGANVVNGDYILAANTVNQNIAALDAAVGETTLSTSATNVTSITTVDTAPVGAGVAKWFVRAELVSDTTRVYATEVYALTDDGTNSDYTKYATLKLGTSIPGLAVTVDTSGGALRLRVASTGAVNVIARRASVLV